MENKDTFRKEYKPLSDDQLAYVGLFKEKAQELMNEFNEVGFLQPNARYMSLAKTALEESVMWSVKAIT